MTHGCVAASHHAPAGRDARTDVYHATLTAAAAEFADRGDGVVVVFLTGHHRPMTVRHIPLTLDQGKPSLGSIPAGSGGAVLIAISEPGDTTAETIAHLDVLVDQAHRASLRVVGELHIPALQPGEVWADLSDLDSPGGVMPART